MIRRDALPNVWNDTWNIDSIQPLELTIAEGSAKTMVVCDEPWLAQQLDCTVLTSHQAQHLHLVVGRNAHLEFYRMQTFSSPKVFINETMITMHSDSMVNMSTITIGTEHARNNVEVRFKGENCHLNADGLYLLDRQQQCDNYIFVEHAYPHCTSKELYKGIIDDSARARFNGHVLVQEGAVGTEAYQNNRNILLTSKAHVDTRPFLEIYNDDVKCSHGSTIGQLDEQALFYMQTRGISRRTAMTMLSYAFCDEVIRNINIPTLREVVSDMVKKRLHGELTSCVDCAIECSSPCNGPNANFDIDVERL